MLADVFENFRNMCLNEHGLNSERFLSSRGLASQAYFKKAKVALEY